MSAEVENNKEEEVKEQKPRKTIKDIFKEYCLLGIKLLELLICAICMGLSYDSFANQRVGFSYDSLGNQHIKLHHVGVMYTAYTGYMVINCVMVISKLIGDRIPYRTASIFAVTGAALFLVTGIILAVDRSDMIARNLDAHPQAYLITNLTTSIIFAFVNSLVFFFEAVLTVKRRQDF